MFFDKLGNALRVLCGDQARRKFGVSFGWNDRLGTFALVAAPEAIEFKGWSDPELLDRGEPFFTAVAGCADRFLKSFAAPGQRIECLAFGFGKLLDVVVEAGNGHPKIFVVKLCKQLSQNRKRSEEHTSELQSPCK